jgi:hypothetical protein
MSRFLVRARQLAAELKQAIATCLITVTLMLTLPPAGLLVFQVVAWCVVAAILMCHSIWRDDFAKRRARELIAAWQHGQRTLAEPHLNTQRAIAFGLWAVEAAVAALAGMPWLATAWLFCLLLTVLCHIRVRTFVRQLDDEVKARIADYDQAVNDAV